MIYALLCRQRKVCVMLFMYIHIAFIVQAQSPITGKIVGAEDQKALPGASVTVKGAVNGTQTDQNGVFTIAATPRDVLVISYAGFETREVTVGSQRNLALTLTPSAGTLDQVVVTGYGRERKKDITGSISIVDMKSLKSVPTGSALQALQGQAAGVNVVTSGVPGAGSFVSVRGISSFGNITPLILVDGVEANLTNINSNDIESVQVLKDAGAAAIYGVRGSNGVIIVTTKKGKLGAPIITYDAYYGTQRPLPGNPFDLLNAEEYMKVVLTANPNSSIFKNGMPDFLYAGPGIAGAVKANDPAADPSRYSFSPTNDGKNYLIQEVNKSGTDWFHEVFKPAPITSHTLAISGGTEKSNYLTSFNYFNQQGTLIETYMKRYSARINTAFKLRDNIRIGQNANIIYREAPGFGNQDEFGVLSAVYKMMPIIPVYDIRGNFGGTWAGPDLGSNQNPVAQQLRTVNDRFKDWLLVGNVYAEVDFMKHFTVRTSIGANMVHAYDQNFSFTQYENRQGNTNPNSYSESASFASTSTWTNTLNYRNTFGKHTVKLLIGSEAIRDFGRDVSGSRDAYFSTDYEYLTLGNGTLSPENSSNGFINSLFSVFSKLDYVYNNKYLLGLTVRRDGSSRFGLNKRYGIFPSVSLGWRVSDENFMKDIAWLSDFKLRGSYGILGSQSNVGAANQYSLYGGSYSNAYYDIRGTSNTVQQGFIQTRIGNSNTGWEENIISNIGFDASLFQNRITLNFEVYKKSINGLLFTQPLPATVGGAAYPVVNIGDIQNKGFDATVSYNHQVNKDLGFTVSTNITAYKNTVVDIPDPGYFFSGSQQGLGSIARNEEGKTVSAFYGYDVIGLFNSAEEVRSSPPQSGAAPGRFKFRDVNNDKSITPDDRTFIGSPNPDFTYGLNLAINYKSFNLSSIFYGSQGNEIVNTIRGYTHFYQGYAGNKSRVLLNAWTPENTNTTVPKIENAGSISTNTALNSYFIEDGSYLKFKSLILGYNVRSALFQKLGISNMRLYLQGTNLFTLTKYTGLDPELGGSSAAFGIDYGNYPNNERSFLFGISTSF